LRPALDELFQTLNPAQVDFVGEGKQHRSLKAKRVAHWVHALKYPVRSRRGLFITPPFTDLLPVHFFIKNLPNTTPKTRREIFYEKGCTNCRNGYTNSICSVLADEIQQKGRDAKGIAPSL